MKQIQPVMIGSVVLGNGTPKICVPIIGKDRDSILKQARQIKEAEPDLVEWRGDFYEDVLDQEAVCELAGQIAGILGEIPILFTFRTKAEGGSRTLAIGEYIELNRSVSKCEHINAVDVEVYMDQKRMKELICEIKSQGKVVIGSHHRFHQTPSHEDMLEIIKGIEKAGAQILKLAVMPLNHDDVNRLLLITNECTCGFVEHPVVTMSMGELGVQSRISGELYGSAMTFACVGEASAPGQLEIQELKKAMADVHLLVEKF